MLEFLMLAALFSASVIALLLMNWLFSPHLLPKPVVRIESTHDAEFEYAVCPRGSVRVEVIRQEDPALLLRYRGWEVYHALRSSNQYDPSENWLAPYTECDRDSEDAFDWREFDYMEDEELEKYTDLEPKLVSKYSLDLQRRVAFAIDRGDIDLSEYHGELEGSPRG